MSRGSSAGTLAIAATTIWAVRSSGRMSLREPLYARPIGERAVATITASAMRNSFWVSGSDGWRPSRVRQLRQDRMIAEDEVFEGRAIRDRQGHPRTKVSQHREP